MSTKTKMEWNQKKCLQLLEELKNNEILWNPKIRAGSNSTQKEEAWKNICDKLNVDIEDARRKLDSLRGSYRREKSRARRTGYGIDGKSLYVSNWFAYNSMTFLDSKDDALTTNYVFKEELDESNFVFGNEGELNETDFKVFDGYKYDQNLCNYELANETRRNLSEPAEYVPKKRSRIQSPVIDNGNENIRDECSTFGEHIANKLRKLDDLSRAEAQHKMNNIIYEAEIKYLRNIVSSSGDKNYQTHQASKSSHIPQNISRSPQQTIRSEENSEVDE